MVGGDSYIYLIKLDLSGRLDCDHIIRKLQVGSTWFLTVLGSLATTQREYIALHAFRRLTLQVYTDIVLLSSC